MKDILTVHDLYIYVIYIKLVYYYFTSMQNIGMLSQGEV